MTARRERHVEIASTQDRAVELAREGAEEGTYVVAGRQVKGRGRLDHAWESPDGGLYLSVVLASPEAHASLLPVALGARLAEAIGERTGLSLEVKWPNDLVLAEGRSVGRKLAGVLVDRVTSPRLGWAAVAGVGVNVHNDPAQLPPELRGRVAILSELLPSPPALEEMEEIVVRVALETAGALRAAAGVAPLRRLARQRLFGVGRWATVDGRSAGRILGLGDEGELWVEREGERMAIRTGDLRVDEGS